MTSDQTTSKFFIIVQDPAITQNGEILKEVVLVPKESLDPGPRGYRVSIIDYDSSEDICYKPADIISYDKFKEKADSELLTDPEFHAHNVYAIIMRTLARIEFVLGRRVSWGFSGHHLHVAPHAFQDANAFYSERDHGLLFGYFPNSQWTNNKEQPEKIFCCLSHDIIAHETTHAIVDGLRDHYTDPSLPQQAGFHEGFADIVAILSVMSLESMIETIVKGRSKKDLLEIGFFERSPILSLAEQFGEVIKGVKYGALRQSLLITPDPNKLLQAQYQEPHLLGEVLVSSILSALVNIWRRRLEDFGKDIPASRVADEGAKAAEHLLNICVRALDYCPPLDLEYEDYLSALLTADKELVPDDKYDYRGQIISGFNKWGIKPRSQPTTETPSMKGIWKNPIVQMMTNSTYTAENKKLKEESSSKKDGYIPPEELDYTGIHFDSLRRDPDEVFKFIWNNRTKLRVFGGAYTVVNWVRPSTKVGPDGFVLRETVAEYTQLINIRAGDLEKLNGFEGFKKPKNLSDDVLIQLTGGGTLLFNEFERLKYHIRKRIDDMDRQNEKLNYWYENNMIDDQNRLGFGPTIRASQFADWHRWRITGLSGVKEDDKKI